MRKPGVILLACGVSVLLATTSDQSFARDVRPCVKTTLDAVSNALRASNAEPSTPSGIVYQVKEGKATGPSECCANLVTNVVTISINVDVLEDLLGVDASCNPEVIRLLLLHEYDHVLFNVNAAGLSTLDGHCEEMPIKFADLSRICGRVGDLKPAQGPLPDDLIELCDDYTETFTWIEQNLDDVNANCPGPPNWPCPTHCLFCDE